ncbi:MAG: right-handed parallel beta-helix repeat-containing protein [Bacteroidales bacterium]|nr:right-handed parallel beta-helix repeat-containing protein [Bacteroidales bacterium]
MKNWIKNVFVVISLVVAWSCSGPGEEKWKFQLYVEPEGTGDGSYNQPLGSIQKALEVAIQHKKKGNSTEIIIRDGVYREFIHISDSLPDNTVPLILRAGNPGKVIITGSVPVMGWKSGRDEKWSESTSKTNVFVAKLSDEIIEKLTIHPLTRKHYPDGKVPNPWGSYVTDNGMFCNGLLVIDQEYYYPLLDPGKLVPGSFNIDYTRQLIFVKLKARIINFKSIELGVEPTIFKIANQNNITISGIQFKHAGWALHDAVIFDNINNLHLENCTFNHNRYAGLQTRRIDKGLIFNCEASHNGGTGSTGSWEGYLRDVTFDGFKANFNNWIGAHFDFTGWAPCGVKWTAARNLVIRNSEFNSNYATGLWLDCENRQVTVENTMARDNIGVGFFLEASKGPFFLKNCRSINNLRGVYISASNDVRLDSCLIKDNDYQVVVFDHWGKGRGPELFEFDFREVETGSLWEAHAVDAVVTNSRFVNREGSDVPFYNELFNDSIGFRNFVSTLTTQNNLYYTDFPEKAFYHDKQFYTLEDWRSLFKQDQGSLLQSINFFDN